MEIKTYKKDFDYSYALGAFPTFEMIKAKPDQVLEVIASPTFTDLDKLSEECRSKNIPLNINEKLINKLSDKGNVYVIGVFRKYSQELDEKKPHLVLVNPSDMGNLGTIIRTAVGFGIMDLAIIEPAADIFNPKTVRASMGSLFRIRNKRFPDFEEYMEYCGASHDNEREIYTFMLNGDRSLTINDCPEKKLYSLVFGNEATGLPDSFLNIGTSIIIPQTEYVDSLNLTIAAGIGMYVFTQKNNT